MVAPLPGRMAPASSSASPSSTLFGPAFYPGGSVAGASVVAAILMIPIGLTFYFWTVTYPRSGGPYVYLSRGAHPLLGFAFSVTESFILLFYGAVAAAFVATMGL